MLEAPVQVGLTEGRYLCLTLWFECDFPYAFRTDSRRAAELNHRAAFTGHPVTIRSARVFDSHTGEVIAQFIR